MTTWLLLTAPACAALAHLALWLYHRRARRRALHLNRGAFWHAIRAEDEGRGW